MQITYVDRWRKNSKEAGNVLNPSIAERKHELLKPYTAIIGNLRTPDSIIEFGENRFIEVTFPDQLRRPVHQYGFVGDFDKEKIFLGIEDFRTYDGDTDTLISAKLLRFNPNGHTWELRPKTTQTSGQYEKIPISELLNLADLWETFPSFGSYARLLRERRIWR